MRVSWKRLCLIHDLMTSSKGTAALLRTDIQRLVAWPKSHVDEPTSTRWLCPRFLAPCKSHLCQHLSMSCVSPSYTPNLQDEPGAGYPQIWQWKPNMISAGTKGMLFVCQLHGQTNHPTFLVVLVKGQIKIGCPHGNPDPVVIRCPVRLGCPTTKNKGRLLNV